MKIKVIKGRNKAQNGKVYDLGAIKEDNRNELNGRVTFENTLFLGKKEYTVEFSEPTTSWPHRVVRLKNVIKAVKGWNHTYFDIVEVIEE